MNHTYGLSVTTGKLPKSLWPQAEVNWTFQPRSSWSTWGQLLYSMSYSGKERSMDFIGLIDDWLSVGVGSDSCRRSGAAVCMHTSLCWKQIRLLCRWTGIRKVGVPQVNWLDLLETARWKFANDTLTITESSKCTHLILYRNLCIEVF